jgi:CheY-like chemotaxis protein
MATILYVEDHPPAQLLMQAIISEITDHDLLVARSAAEAERIARQTLPDLYILDLDLPDGDGLTLAGTLTTLHSAPVILVSAYAESVESDSLDYVYLAKPLDPDHVARTVQRTLA